VYWKTLSVAIALVLSSTLPADEPLKGRTRLAKARLTEDGGIELRLAVAPTVRRETIELPSIGADVPRLTAKTLPAEYSWRVSKSNSVFFTVDSQAILWDAAAARLATAEWTPVVVVFDGAPLDPLFAQVLDRQSLVVLLAGPDPVDDNLGARRASPAETIRVESVPVVVGRTAKPPVAAVRAYAPPARPEGGDATPQQRFKLTRIDNGYFVLTDTHSGHCWIRHISARNWEDLGIPAEKP
jgi:hypothetical protein